MIKRNWFYGIILIWLVLFVGSICIFQYVKNRPNIVLWMEDFHPSVAYEKGKEALKQGRIGRAVEFFQKGQAYFKQLFKESELARHKELWAYGLLLEANAYKDSASLKQKKQSIPLYRQVIELAPTLSNGQPCVSLGEMYQELGDYENAVEAYTLAMDFSSAEYALPPYFGRGYCYKYLNVPAKAAEDWYIYIRFHQQAMREWMLQEMLSLNGADSGKALYIEGYARMKLKENKEEAIERFKHFLKENPSNRSAEYYLSLLTGAEYKPNYGEIPLSEMFPPNGPGQRNLGEIFIDLYTSVSGDFIFQSKFETIEGIRLPVQIHIFIWGGPKASWLVDQKGAIVEKERISMRKGRNILRVNINKTYNEKNYNQIRLTSIKWAKYQ
ncbi:hypothetical protein GF373_07845 [bacterium]|nr:hypothetical protein [bacterium]